MPRRTLDYLASGAVEGERNAELFDAACQFRDAGRQLEEAGKELLSRATTDGLSESEALQTIRSAYAKAPREPVLAGGRAQTAQSPTSAPSVPPEPVVGGFLKLLEHCFQDEEFVAVAPAAETEDGEVKPRKGVTMKAADWKARVTRKGGIDRMFGTKLGLFVRVNPMIKDGSRNDDVTAFRHVLVEFDHDAEGNLIPKAEQFRRIIDSGMPVSVVIDSGNKSLHAWIRVDAPDKDEYQRRVAIVWKWFGSMDLDRQNRNPSRLSRCPEGWRTVDGEVRAQSLLATKLGAESWDMWETRQGDLEVPPFVDLAEIIAMGCEPERPTVADVGLGTGMLYAGRINEIHGEPGTGKSNVAMALSNAVMSSGGLVIYIDPEDTPQGFTRRSLQLGADPEDLTHRCRYLNSSSPDDIGLTQRWAAVHRPVLVVIDGMAECMSSAGRNEDKAEEVITFIREQIRPFAERAGAAVLISDHVTKSWEDRGLWSRGSGAKMGRYDGVSYALSMIEAYAPGQAGSVQLTVAKDRNGGVGVKGKPVAEIHFTPAPGERTVVTFKAPGSVAQVSPVSKIMARIVEYLRENGGSAPRTEIRKLGKSQTVDRGIEKLEQSGRIKRIKEGRRHIFNLMSPCTYRMGKRSA